MASSERIFEEIASKLQHFAEEEEEIIEVNIELKKRLILPNRLEVTVVNHYRDPKNLLNRDKDKIIELDNELYSSIQSLAKQHTNEIPGIENCTIRVYKNGDWSYGATMEDIKLVKNSSIEMHGGESDRNCRFAKCENKALRDKELCYEHYYADNT